MNQSISTFTLTCIGALGYILLGYWGLSFAIPPGYSSPIWPPAGLAFGLAIFYGPRALIGILLGSSTLNYLIGPSFDSFQFSQLIIPVSIALGTTLQSYIGAELYRKIISRFSFFKHYPAIGLTLATLSSCILASCIGTFTLYYHGILSSERLMENWLHWYIGDSLGAILITPILVTFLQKSESRARVLLKVGLPLGLVFLVVSLTFSLTRANEEALIRQKLKQYHELIAADLQTHLQIAHSQLNALIGLHQASHYVDPLEFQTFTQQLDKVHEIPMEFSRDSSYQYHSPLSIQANQIGESITFTVSMAQPGIGQIQAKYQPNFHLDKHPLIQSGLYYQIIINDSLSTQSQSWDQGYSAFLVSQLVHHPQLKLQLQLQPNVPFIKTISSRASWIVLVLGALISGFLGIFILNAFSQKLYTHQLIDQRTDELNQALANSKVISQSKSRFIAHLSHEIRTPLNGIIGGLDIINTSQMDPEDRDNVKLIRSASQHLLQILNDVLDLSKIEADKMEIAPTAVNLQELIDGVHQLFLPLAKQHQIQFITQFELKHSYYFCDASRIRQVIHNILSNSLKFTETGTIALRLKEVDSASDHDTILFEVEDTGIGMTQEHQQKLFDAYSQAEPDTQNHYGGTGLGMAICKEIVNLLEGEIQVQSQYGQGTLFQVSIPLKRIVDPEITQNLSAEVELLVNPRKILIAEDNLINQKVIQSAMTKFNLPVVMVSDGIEALKYLEKNSVDLILMDINMPNMDGVSCFNEIRKVDNQTPIVAFTANVMKEELDKYHQMGFTDTFSKPFTKTKLIQLLNKHLGDSNS